MLTIKVYPVTNIVMCLHIIMWAVVINISLYKLR